MIIIGGNLLFKKKRKKKKPESEREYCSEIFNGYKNSKADVDMS